MLFWVHWYTAAFVIERSEFTKAMLNQFRMSCVRPDLSIAESLLVCELYIIATRHLSPEAVAAAWELWVKRLLPQSESFLPEIDVKLAFHWRSLLGRAFPRSLPHFRDFGHDLLALVRRVSAADEAVAVKGEPQALPVVCRFVDSISLFASLTLKWASVICNIEANGLDIALIGSHASLLNKFIDKTREPLPDLSPPPAVLHFNTLQNIPNIPKKYVVNLNVYLGQCLHYISNDTVVLQNAVKYLWKAAGQLIELEQFELAGEL